MMAAWLALWIAQDEAWDWPREADRVADAVPWRIEGQRLLTLEGKEHCRIVLRALDGKKIAETEAEFPRNGLAAFAAKDRLHVFYDGPDHVLHRTVDLATGRATRAEKVAFDGLDAKTHRPAVLVHDGSWYLAVAAELTVDGMEKCRTVLGRSTDEGWSWSVVSPGSWKLEGAVLLAAIGDAVHVFPTNSARLASFSTSDGAKTWKENDLAGDAGAVAVGADGPRACLLHSMAGSKRLGVLRTDDGGKSWSKGGTLPRLASDYQIAMSGTRVVYNPQWEWHGSLHWSSDGGATWKAMAADDGVDVENGVVVAAFVEKELVVSFLHYGRGRGQRDLLLVRRYGSTTLSDPEKARILDRISQLDHDDLDVRDEAQKEIASFGYRAFPFLRERLKTAEGERRARIEALLKPPDAPWWNR